MHVHFNVLVFQSGNRKAVLALNKWRNQKQSRHVVLLFYLVICVTPCCCGCNVCLSVTEETAWKRRRIPTDAEQQKNKKIKIFPKQHCAGLSGNWSAGTTNAAWHQRIKASPPRGASKSTAARLFRRRTNCERWMWARGKFLLLLLPLPPAPSSPLTLTQELVLAALMSAATWDPGSSDALPRQRRPQRGEHRPRVETRSKCSNLSLLIQARRKMTNDYD